MSQPYPDALALSRRVLKVLVVLNLLMGLFILALFGASLVAPDLVMRGLGVRPIGGSEALAIGMRLIMVIGICAVPITHVVLTRLADIVETLSAVDRLTCEKWARNWLTSSGMSSRRSRSGGTTM